MTLKKHDFYGIVLFYDHLIHFVLMSSNPFLPQFSSSLGAAHTRKHRVECGEKFYLAALELAQAHWVSNKPAQALLQLNKALMADLADDAAILKIHALPYRALVWFLENRPTGYFIGNPVRHFQHLATRMSGPRVELRTHRAWACYHIARKILPTVEFPPDEQQVVREKIEFPTHDELLAYFKSQNRPIELKTLKSLFKA